MLTTLFLLGLASTLALALRTWAARRRRRRVALAERRLRALAREASPYGDTPLP